MRLARRSFSITCGVEMMTSAFSHISLRFFGGILPVNIVTAQSGSAWLKKLKCCSTSGFVGERINAFPPNSLKRAAITISATIVFPSPVGSTIRHEPLSADDVSASWYSRCSIASFLISGCEMYRSIVISVGTFQSSVFPDGWGWQLHFDRSSVAQKVFGILWNKRQRCNFA